MLNTIYSDESNLYAQMVRRKEGCILSREVNRFSASKVYINGAIDLLCAENPQLDKIALRHGIHRICKNPSRNRDLGMVFELRQAMNIGNLVQIATVRFDGKDVRAVEQGKLEFVIADKGKFAGVRFPDGAIESSAAVGHVYMIFVDPLLGSRMPMELGSLSALCSK